MTVDDSSLFGLVAKKKYQLKNGIETLGFIQTVV